MAPRKCKNKKTNNLSNLKTSTFCEICHKRFTFFTSKLKSNPFPSNSHGGKPKTQLGFSLHAQLFCNVYITKANITIAWN